MEAVVTEDMLSAKKRFQKQVQEARTPARTLFSVYNEDQADEFVEVTGLTTSSPYKPSLSTLSLTGKTSDNEKSLSHVIRRLESGLEATTNNLIQNRSILKD